MPWVRRASHDRRRRLRRDLRRWRYDHSEHVLALCIGASVVAATVGAILIWRVF